MKEYHVYENSWVPRESKKLSTENLMDNQKT